MTTFFQQSKLTRQPSTVYKHPLPAHTQRTSLLQPAVNSVNPSNSHNQIRIPTSPTQHNIQNVFPQTIKQYPALISPRKANPNIQRSFIGLPHTQKNPRRSFPRDPNLDVIQQKPLSAASQVPVYHQSTQKTVQPVPAMQQRQVLLPSPSPPKQVQRANTTPHHFVSDNAVAYYMEKLEESQRLLSQIQGLMHHRQKSEIPTQQAQTPQYQEPIRQPIQHPQQQHHQAHPPHENFQEVGTGFNQLQYQRQIEQMNMMHKSDQQQYYPQAHRIVFNTRQNEARQLNYAQPQELQQIEEVNEVGHQTYQIDELKQIVFGDQPYEQVDGREESQNTPDRRYSNQYSNQHSHRYSGQQNSSTRKYNISVQEAEDQLRIPQEHIEYEQQHLITQQSEDQRQHILDTINNELEQEKRQSHSKRQSHTVSARNPNHMMYLDGAQLLSYYDLHQRLLRDKDELAVLYQQSFGLGPVNE